MKGQLSMIYTLFIHRPKPGLEELMLASMKRYRETMIRCPGCLEVHALRDQWSNALIGMAIWESQEALANARPALAEALKDEPYMDWLTEEPEGFLCEEG